MRTRWILLAVLLMAGTAAAHAGQKAQDPIPPEWFTRWVAIEPARHLELDYVRQAVNLGMHRRPADLVRPADEELQLLSCWFDVQLPYFGTYLQRRGRDVVRVRVEPYPPFGEIREHIIHKPLVLNE